MAHNEKRFFEEVKYYSEIFNDIKDKLVFLKIPINNEKAFMSIAPMSRAIHEKGGELHVMGVGKNSPMLNSLEKCWQINEDFNAGKKTKAVDAYKNFASFAEKTLGKGELKRIFAKPDIVMKVGRNGFTGDVKADFKAGWFKRRKQKLLEQTCKTVWSQVFNLKNTERVATGFELIPTKKELDKPLQDYLDSYAISYEMMQGARKVTKYVGTGSSSPKYSMLVPMDRISDLKTTLSGCELSKDSKEAVFKRFKVFSKFIGTSKIKHNSATFFVSGKGYPGKHAFGQEIGYPTQNGKTRWQSPGGIIYQLDHMPQTRYEDRAPKARVGFTDTLPLDIFIKTSNVDWFEIKKKNDVLRRIAEKSDKFIVKSGIKGKHVTEFEVGLVKPDGSRRKPKGSDIETRSIIKKSYLKETGIKAGNMANIPGGEMFVTPEYLKGKFVGDVVISIDQSYRLNATNPLIIEATKSKYKVVKGPKKVVEKLDEKKEEAWQLLKAQEKMLPKELVDMKKRNFNKIGEFAINTNPQAELCDYLIVNEKIANMIHIAVGSGFEDDRATEYHYDIVIDAPRQKLDIYGLTAKGEKLWVMKKGKFVIKL